jgi:hypothetical protein
MTEGPHRLTWLKPCGDEDSLCQGGHIRKRDERLREVDQGTLSGEQKGDPIIQLLIAQEETWIKAS